jgi:hypothetical protein
MGFSIFLYSLLYLCKNTDVMAFETWTFEFLVFRPVSQWHGALLLPVLPAIKSCTLSERIGCLSSVSVQSNLPNPRKQTNEYKENLTKRNPTY